MTKSTTIRTTMIDIVTLLRALEEKTMTQVTFDLPVEIKESLRIPAAEQQQRLRTELGVRLYQKELLSFGKARALAGLTKWEFHELLAEEGIVRRYDTEELEQDLETLQRLE